MVLIKNKKYSVDSASEKQNIDFTNIVVSKLSSSDGDKKGEKWRSIINYTLKKQGFGGRRRLAFAGPSRSARRRPEVGTPAETRRRRRLDVVDSNRVVLAPVLSLLIGCRPRTQTGVDERSSARQFLQIG